MRKLWLNNLIFMAFALGISITGFGQTTFPGTGLGAIPDGTVCGTPGTARNVVFSVSGISGNVTNLSLQTTFGPPPHGWMGDITATLIAPNGSLVTIFGRTGATTATSVGDGSDLGGPYTFNNAATLNWWDTALATDATTPIPSGIYRTSQLGGLGATNAVTDMNAPFAATPANGNWTLRLTDSCPSDTVSITAANLTVTGVLIPQHAADFNGDGKTDWVLIRATDTPIAEGEGAAEGSVGGFDPANSELKGYGRPAITTENPQSPGLVWYVKTNGSTAFSGTQWGDAATDFVLTEDFDGDGKSDYTVWREGIQSVFYILRSNGNIVTTDPFGQTGDDPFVVGDYDGDNKADTAVYRCPPFGSPAGICYFYYRGSNTPGGTITFAPWGFGNNGDFFPYIGDFDGDGKNDFCIQRTNPTNSAQGQFVLSKSGNGGVEYIDWGAPSDAIIPGDYDGDGKTDFCVRRTVSGVRNHYILTRTGNIRYVQWGITGDVSVPGDYDADGKTDVAVWRPSTTLGNCIFYVNQSSNGALLAIPLGQCPAGNCDYPVAAWANH